ncbi:hypothetical protein HYE82_23340 [Streptomyces sp. BR123]|uniref:hypothetical protein n=1 Tax=Streptomyces sp. BR123 TaxID=2749828 RepID=UPI0015C44566|nr:hypothetical protein [Streptomyces sp. BR123]NXY97256.1 hypothetical protein [Streptomyces sp. BR123]
MRLRTAAVAFLGAFALAVPLAGPSMADDFDDRPHLGRLDYIVDGERRQIRPADNDTCYELTGTSRREPATAVRNDTKSRATLFTEDGCNGRPERVLEPKDVVYDVAVRSVVFTPVHVDKDDKHDPFGDSHFDGHEGFDSASRPEHAVMGAAQPAVLPEEDGPEPQDGPAPEEQRQEEQRREEQGRQDEQRQQEEQRREEHQRQDEQWQQDEQRQQEEQRREEHERQDEQRQQEQPPAEERQEMPEQQERQEQGPDMAQDMPEEHHEGQPDMFDAVFRSIP